MTPTKPDLGKSVPDRPPPLAADLDEPTLFEIAQLSAMLATSAENQGKPAIELTHEALNHWQAAQDVNKAKIETQVLLATVAKLWDDKNYFEADPSNKQSKAKITHERWVNRLYKYPGDKLKLLFEFVFAEAVPAAELLAELFPSAKKSRSVLVGELLKFTGKGAAKYFLWKVAQFLTSSEPEADQELLLSAIETGDSLKAEAWFRAHIKAGDSSILVPVLELIATAEQNYSNCLHGANPAVPALLCRPLIDYRQMQISGIRGNAARKKADSRFLVKKRLAKQSATKTKPALTKQPVKWTKSPKQPVKPVKKTGKTKQRRF